MGVSGVDPLAVAGLEVRTAETSAESQIQSHGVINGGGKLMRDGWPNLTKVFSIRQRLDDQETPPGNGIRTFYDQRRFPQDFLCVHPVDPLFVDNETLTPPVDFSPRGWQNLLQDSAATDRTGAVVEGKNLRFQRKLKG